jgi:hypothetical protein
LAEVAILRETKETGRTRDLAAFIFQGCFDCEFDAAFDTVVYVPFVANRK